jgi:hypothetical protein
MIRTERGSLAGVFAVDRWSFLPTRHKKVVDTREESAPTA